MRRARSLIGPLVLLVASLQGCAAGEDTDSGPSPFTAGPAGDAGDEGDSGEDPGASGPVDPSAGGGIGTSACCESHVDPGCDEPEVEQCVCVQDPECCQWIWSDECVALASECGALACEGEVDGTGGMDSTGEPPPEEPPPEEPPPEEPPPEEPPPEGPPCPCMAGVNNFCCYGVNNPACPPTQPGGYCDPNGDGLFDDGDWDLGWYEHNEFCGPSTQSC